MSLPTLQLQQRVAEAKAERKRTEAKAKRKRTGAADTDVSALDENPDIDLLLKHEKLHGWMIEAVAPQEMNEGLGEKERISVILKFRNGLFSG